MYKIVKEPNSEYIYSVYKENWWFKDKYTSYFVAPNKEMSDTELIKEAMKITHPRIVVYEA